MLMVNREFNLLVTCARNREFFASRDLESILADIGDEDPSIWGSGISGVLLAMTSLNPLDIPYRMRELLRSHPWMFREIKRVIPIEYNVDTSLEEFKRLASELAKRIPDGSTYKVEVKRRYTEMGRMEIIESFASKIDRKVSLESPDYIVLVEVLGPRTGVSLIKPDGVLSVEREVANY